MQDSLSNLAKELGELLQKNRLSLCTAESCTGGGLSYHLTSIPESSTWFERGFVTYSNAAKIEMLDVQKDILDTFGAVSKETAVAMAKGALNNSQAQISIAITGIAGPSGGTINKPVGTVWLAVATRNIYSELLQLSGDREAICTDTIKRALKKLLDIVMMEHK